VDVNKARYSPRLAFPTPATQDRSTSHANLTHKEDRLLPTLLQTLASTAIDVTLWSNNFNYQYSLYKNRQFLGMKNGLQVVMDDSWLQTKRMIQMRGPMQAAFNSRVNGLRYLKWGGSIFGWATTGYSGAKFFMNPNWSDGLDTVFGAIGYYYWPVGLGYTWFRYIVPAAVPYVVQLEMERAEEIRKGNWSAALWRPGRALR